MWIYQFEKIAGGDPARIAWLAHQNKLTHVFVRVGSSVQGLRTLAQAGSLIPHAHKLGIKVIAWYFPYYNNLVADVQRSLDTIRYTVAGQSFDGFAADIETATGADFTAANIRAYSAALRAGAPDAYLIGVPPRPSDSMIKRFPYDAMMPYYDAVAPMVYWGRFSPTSTTVQAMKYLARWGKPIAPIGQMYDMHSEGGPKGNPPAHETWAFMKAAKAYGAVGVSFWSWQHAKGHEWRALREFGW